MGTLILIVLGLSLMAIFVVFESSDSKRKREAREAFIAGGGLEGWSGRVGLEMRDDEVSLSGARGHDGVDIVASFDVYDLEALFTGSFERLTFTVDLRGRVPADVTAERHRVLADGSNTRTMHASARLTGFLVEGNARAVLAFSGYEVLTRLKELLERPEFEFSGTTLSGGVLTVVVTSPDVFLTDVVMRDTLGALARVIDASPELYEEDVALSEVLLDASRPSLERWRAGRMLFADHARSGALVELASRLDGLDALSAAACGCWGAYPTFDVAPEARHAMLAPMADDEHAREDVRGALAEQVGWFTFLDVSLDPATRLEAARRALRGRGAPRDAGARDAALVMALTSAPANGLDRGEALRVLGRTGWDVSGAHAEALARGGDAGVRSRLLDHILDRGVAPEDAPALAALASARVSGAQSALAQLKSSAGAGRLSLAADDGARGGLSQANGRGTLTAVDPDEET